MRDNSTEYINELEDVASVKIHAFADGKEVFVTNTSENETYQKTTQMLFFSCIYSLTRHKIRELVE